MLPNTLSTHCTSFQSQSSARGLVHRQPSMQQCTDTLDLLSHRGAKGMPTRTLC